jgi:hypothetical protein
MRTAFFVLGLCVIVGIIALLMPTATPTQVQGIEKYDGPESGKILLDENGFVVVPRFYHRIFGPYLDSPLPPFITADSVHRTFHVIFEESLKTFEETAHTQMAGIIAELQKALPKDAATSGESRQLAEDFLAVTQCLLEGNKPSPSSEKVTAQLVAIRGAAKIGPSSIFPYKLDYSQFKPRGFYTHSPELSNYFRAMTWMGCAAFRLESETETAAAMLLADVFRQVPEARELWRTLDRTYTQLLFQSDDLSIEEYASLLEEMDPVDTTLPETAGFQARGKALRDPRYNDMVLSPEQQANWIAETKGMRFMGRRYLPDGGVFDKVASPKVPSRAFPQGLDVLAANGSTRAREHLGAELQADATYAKGLEQATEELAQDKATFASHYIQIMKVMECITAPPHEQAAPFAKTDAYADKNLMTALAVWASTRHAWILHAKQNMGVGASSEPPSFAGYIEPNPEFFAEMEKLGQLSVALFQNRTPEEGASGRTRMYSPLHSAERFEQFAAFVQKIQGLLDKQMRDEAYDEREMQWFAEYGDTLLALQDDHANTLLALQDNHTNVPRDEAFPWMGLATDVFTESLGAQCLEVATGGAMPIYAVVPYAGRDQLVLGGVYSYYEFQQSISNRLTDEAWHAQWDKGEAPALPPWSASFIVGGFDVERLIERLQAGEEAPEAMFVQDPRLDEFLMKAVQREPVTDEEGYIQMSLKTLAAKKMPAKMWPVLWEDALAMEVPDYEWQDQFRKKMDEINFDFEKHKPALDAFQARRGRVFQMGMQIAPCLNKTAVDALREYAQRSPNHMATAAYLSMECNEKAVEDFWLWIVEEDCSAAASQWALTMLRRRGSSDAMLGLLRILSAHSGTQKAAILGAIAHLITPEAHNRADIFGKRLPARKEAALQETQKKALRDALTTFMDEHIAKSAPGDRRRRLRKGPNWTTLFQLARKVDVPDLTQRIVKGSEREAWELEETLAAANAMAQEDALQLFKLLLQKADERDLYQIFEAVAFTNDKAMLPLLRPYLEDTSPTGMDGLRVCDLACLITESVLDIPRTLTHLPFEEGAERNAGIKDFDKRRFRLLKETAE